MDDPTLREPWPLDQITADNLRRAGGATCRPCYAEEELRRQIGELRGRLARNEEALALKDKLNDALRNENVELRRELANVRSGVQLDRVDEMILGGPSVGDE
jgi:hypothetical protein